MQFQETPGDGKQLCDQESELWVPKGQPGLLWRPRFPGLFILPMPDPLAGQYHGPGLGAHHGHSQGACGVPDRLGSWSSAGRVHMGHMGFPAGSFPP